MHISCSRVKCRNNESAKPRRGAAAAEGRAKKRVGLHLSSDWMLKDDPASESKVQNWTRHPPLCTCPALLCRKHSSSVTKDFARLRFVASHKHAIPQCHQCAVARLFSVSKVHVQYVLKVTRYMRAPSETSRSSLPYYTSTPSPLLSIHSCISYGRLFNTILSSSV